MGRADHDARIAELDLGGAASVAANARVTVAHQRPETSALAGATVIRDQLASLPGGPGVYRMLDAKGEVLYVGKAKSLRKRVPAYTKPQALSARLQRMVALTRALEVVTTSSDVEALLLECNLIKRHRPAFNIVLRDDKSFP
jgi:excinuclease ABC subunit C